MNQKTLIALNATMGYLRLGVRIIIGLFLSPFVLGHVGEGPYGSYLTVMSLSSILLVLDAGMSAALTRFIARESSLQDDRACQEAWLTSLAAYMVPFAVILLVFAPAAPLFVRFWTANVETQASFQTLLLIAAVMCAFEFPANAYRGVLLGLQKHYVISAIEIAFEAVRAAAIVGMLLAGVRDIVWVLATTAIVSVVRAAVFVATVHLKTPWARFDWQAVRWDRLKSLLAFSLTAFIGIVGYTLNLHMHRLIIGQFLGMAAVAAYYFVASYFRELLENIVMQFVTTMIPVVSKYDARGERKVLARLLLKGSKYATILAGLIAAPLCAFATPLLRIWLWRTPEFSQYVPLLIGSILITLIQLSRGATNALLIGMGSLKLLGIVSLGAVILDGVIAIILIKTTTLGLYALLLSTGIAITVRRTIMTWHVCRLLGLSIPQFLRHTIVAPAFPALFAAMIGFALRLFGEPYNWVSLGVFASISLLGGLAFCFTFTLNADERSEVLSPLLDLRERLESLRRPRIAS